MQKIVLYLTSKAFRQTIDHAVKEAGLVTLDCNNVIGNTVSIEEFMNKKGYLLGDNDIDYLIVDLSVLIDREESIVNALSGFLTMHDEKVRVIVVAPKNVAGDRILSELFGIGIRNFASGSDFVVIRQKLLKCLSESGMSYKDAIEYKDVKERTHEEKEYKELNMVMIGIVGTQSRVGCTHNAIIIANQLKQMGYAVAYIEMNHSGALQLIREDERIHMIDQMLFISRNIDFYPDCDEERLRQIQNEKVYNFLVLDFGNFTECNINCYNRSHVKIVIGNVQPWEINHLADFWRRYDDEARNQINFYINFLQKEKDRKALEKVFNIKMHYLDFVADPFEANGFPDLKELLEDYIPPDGGKKGKRFFFLGRKKVK